MYALPPMRRRKSASDVPADVSPEAVIDAVATLREAVDLAIASDDADVIRAALSDASEARETVAAVTALAEDDAIDGDDDAWADALAAIDEMADWLVADADADAKRRHALRGFARKARLSRDERLRLAVAIASRGRSRGGRGGGGGMGGGRRRDAADMVLDAFYGGLGAIFTGAGMALRAAGVVTLVAGEALGRGIQRVAEAADSGIVRVAGYTREDGTEVAGYERAPPGAS
jgi:hypothetical protein